MASILQFEEIHESWKPFFTERVQEQLKAIEKDMGDCFTPRIENVLRFTREDLNAKKVIWLGQDPYFQPNVANGRSFQPNDLESWFEPFRQVSLRNIMRLVHASYNNYETYDQIKSFKDILIDIKQGEFELLPPKLWFDSLERQGVLFLNTSFSCEVNKANSHKQIWCDFAKQLLQYISEVKPEMIWFLWGKEAISNKEYIQQGTFFESRHPMMCSSKYEDDFLKSRCFLDTFDTINWLG